MFDSVLLVILLSATISEEESSPFCWFLDVVPLHLCLRNLKNFKEHQSFSTKRMNRKNRFEKAIQREERFKK